MSEVKNVVENAEKARETGVSPQPCREKAPQVYNVETYDLDDLMIEIFERLKTMEDASTTTRKYWFNGEGDSNQTTYEYLSNNLKICVMAKDKKVALVLHTFLRQIIDQRDHNWYVNWLVDKDEFTMDEILDCLASSNDQYGQVFNPKEEGLYVECTLGYGEKAYKVKEYIGDVDCWDLWRIGADVGALDISDKYPDRD